MSDTHRIELLTEMDEVLQGGAGNGDATIVRFGRNPAVGVTAEMIWDGGNGYTFQSSADVLNVVSASADDADEGTGAWVVTLVGLDSNWAEIQEEVTLSGVTPVQTTASFLRINYAYVKTAGSGGVNAGNITITFDGTSDVGALILAGNGSALHGWYSVPANKTLYISNGTISVGKGKDATIYVHSRNNAVANASKNTGFVLESYQNNSSFHFMPYMPITEKSDFWVEALTTAGDIAVSISFCGVLRD